MYVYISPSDCVDRHEGSEDKIAEDTSPNSVVMVVIEGLNFSIFPFFSTFFYSAFLTFHIVLSLFYYSHMCPIDHMEDFWIWPYGSQCIYMTFLQVCNFFLFLTFFSGAYTLKIKNSEHDTCTDFQEVVKRRFFFFLFSLQ